MFHHVHRDVRSPALGRLRFLGRRTARTLIGYAVAILAMTAIVNASMEATVQSQITEAIQGAVMGNTDLKSPEEISTFKRDTRIAMEKSFGLDRPRLERILVRTWDVITLDLGRSRSTVVGLNNRTGMVKDIILDRLPHTLLLFTSSTLISILLGVRLGSLMAGKPGGTLDRSASIVTMLMYGTPAWWVASFMILFFVYGIPVFRVGMLQSPSPPPGLVGQVLDYLYYLSLPVLTLVVVKTWSFAYYTRAMMVVPLQEDFVMAARGRGIPEKKILSRHGLRVAAPGIATMAGQAFAQSIMGDILVERVMARPGLGSALFNALGWNDIPLITGILAVVTAIYCLSFLILDVAYAMLDPRIAYGTS